MKYFKIQVELGHMGCGDSLPSWIYIKEKDILSAIKRAKRIPAVKHSRLPLQAIQITEEDYKVGIKENNYYNKMDQLFSF